jgi:hypothetical protein
MPPSLSSEKKLGRFLTDLALRKNVSASTQNQAFNNILFSFENGRVFSLRVLRAGRPRQTPVVSRHTGLSVTSDSC